MLGYILPISRNFYIQFLTISFALGLDPPVEFLVIIFHCPKTTALLHAFLSYIFPSYLVTSYVVERHP